MKTFTLTVTEHDAEVIGVALNELPRKMSEPVFAKLQQQIGQQQRPAAVAPPETPEPIICTD